MKNSVSVRQIQEIDRFAIEKLGIPSLVLMENAGRAVAFAAREFLGKKKNPFVCIFCGTGNNAGDGFVTARHLSNLGVAVKVFIVGGAERLKNDALVNYRILKNCGFYLKNINQIGETERRHLRKADLIVDALFGVGLNREIKPPYFNVIREMNDSAKPILSVDTPSGLDATTGKICGICVKADMTVTFTAAKKGFFREYGPAHAGKIKVAGIGIPLCLAKRAAGHR